MRHKLTDVSIISPNFMKCSTNASFSSIVTPDTRTLEGRLSTEVDLGPNIQSLSNH